MASRRRPAPHESSETQARACLTAVGAHLDVRVEDREEALEVAVPGGREEGIDDGPLVVEVDVGHRRALDPAAGSARELPRRRRGPIDDRRDLVERHAEHVVEHEGHAFGRRERVEDDEHREPDRIAEQRLLLGIGSRLRAHDRIGDVGFERRLAPGLPRSEHVQGDPSDDSRQPGTQVVDVARVRAAQPDPRLLDGVVGLGQRAEHPVGDAPQVRAVRLEALGEPVLVVHVVIFLRAFVKSTTRHGPQT